MDIVNQLKNSLSSIFAPHLTPKKSKKKLKAEDNLHTKLMKLLTNAGSDLKKLHQDIENAVKNARIKDKFANRIMKKANVLIAAWFTFVLRTRINSRSFYLTYINY